MLETRTNPEKTALKIMDYVKNINIEEGYFFRKLTEPYCRKNIKAQTKSDLLNIEKGLRRYVRYTLDCYGIETLKNPIGIMEDIKTYGYLIGDCDDITLFCNLCLFSVGYRVGCKIIEQFNEGYYSHIYSVVEIDGEILPFDLCSENRVMSEPCPTKQITDYKIFLYER